MGSRYPSSKELILRHSKARVLKASSKRYLVSVDPITGKKTFSRPLHDLDVVEGLARKFG